MDYYARQCAVKFETTKSISSRNRGRKEELDAAACNLLNALLTKKESPMVPDEDTASKKTAIALSFDIAEPEAQSDISETESVTVHGIINTETDAKKIPETGSIPEFNEVTPLQQTHCSKTSLSKVPLNAIDTERQRCSIPMEEINHEPKSRSIAAVVTPGTEVTHSSQGVMAEVVTQSDFEQTEHFPGSVVPLDQRPRRRKPRSQAQDAEVQKVDRQKSQPTNDLDFLLSLKAPVKEVQISSLRPSPVTKPTPEEGTLRHRFPRPLVYLYII
jgi:hypothetical protein